MLAYKDISCLHVLLQLSEKYGPVITVYLGWQRTVVLVGYDVVMEALVDRGDEFSGRGPLPFLVKATKGYGNTGVNQSIVLPLFLDGFLKRMYATRCWSTSFVYCTLSGLGISNGERWRQLRRFTLTTLRDFGMGRKGMEEWIQEESKHLEDCLNTFKGKVCLFSTIISKSNNFP